MDQEEERTGRDLWHAFNALLQFQYGQYKMKAVRSFDLCIDFRTSEPLEERCHYRTAENLLSVNNMMWTRYGALDLHSLVMHMRDFELCGKRLGVLIRTFVVADRRQRLNNTSTPALVEDVSEALDGAEEQLEEFEDLLVASGLGTIKQMKVCEMQVSSRSRRGWLRFVCELADERYHNKGPLSSAQYARFLEKRNTSSA